MVSPSAGCSARTLDGAPADRASLRDLRHHEPQGDRPRVGRGRLPDPSIEPPVLVATVNAFLRAAGRSRSGGPAMSGSGRSSRTPSTASPSSTRGLVCRDANPALCRLLLVERDAARRPGRDRIHRRGAAGGDRSDPPRAEREPRLAGDAPAAAVRAVRWSISSAASPSITNPVCGWRSSTA